eukprot:1140844-Pelagomonas_calceolata.AAC.3
MNEVRQMEIKGETGSFNTHAKNTSDMQPGSPARLSRPTVHVYKRPHRHQLIESSLKRPEYDSLL